MHLPPLPPTDATCYHKVGNVIIHPSAAIAAGVLLCAEQDSSIQIGAGACIGMGSILHAQGGRLEIAEGAIVGAGALVMGSSKIGIHACVGAASTIINSEVASGAVVPPGSLLGDTSRQGLTSPPTATASPGFTPQPFAPESLNGNEHSALVPSGSETAIAPQRNTTVSGVDYINRLKGKLFPEAEVSTHSQSLTEDVWVE
jgi:carbon dioxide concentrating mechanism protein CcmN